jgi:serine/threonine protein kinase
MTRLAADQVLGCFRVVASLGRGGMAAVYRAEEAGLGRGVALKVLSAELMTQSLSLG